MFRTNSNRIKELQTYQSAIQRDIERIKSQLDSLVTASATYRPAQTEADASPLLAGAIDHLKDANQALVDIYKNRWSFFGVIFPLVTILLTFTFAYQIWKVAELKEIADRSVNAVNKVEEVKNLLVCQGKVQGLFAEALSLLNMGYRESTRERHSFALKEAKRAVEQLSKVNGMLGAVKATDEEEKNIIKSLQGTSDSLRMAAYELQARSYTYIFTDTGFASERENRIKLDPLKDTARAMLDIDDNRWEGHHWLGIYYLHINSMDQAAKEYKFSVDHDLDIKLDAINLAEIYFLKEDFTESKNEAELAVNFDVNTPVEIQLVGEFFQRAADLLLNHDLSQEQAFETDCGARQRYAHNYDFTRLHSFAEAIGKDVLKDDNNRKFTDEEKNAVKHMISILVQSGNQLTTVKN